MGTCQLQQGLSQASLRLEQDDALQLKIQVSDPLCQHSQNTNCHVWIQLHKVEKILALQGQSLRIIFRRSCGRAGSLIQQSQFAKEVAGYQIGQEHIASLLRRDAQLDPSDIDYVERGTKVTLVEDDFALAIATPGELAGKAGEVVYRHRREQRCASQ